MKRLGIFVLGVMVGATIMAYLASRASSIYSRTLESSYSFEQQRQAARAANNGQWLLAAMAYHSMASASTSTDKPFGVERPEWGLPFPLASLILEEIEASSDPAGTGRMLDVGTTYARYAYALEKSGQTAEAAQAWEQAKTHGGFKSTEEARETATMVIGHDIDFFARQE